MPKQLKTNTMQTQHIERRIAGINIAVKRDIPSILTGDNIDLKEIGYYDLVEMIKYIGYQTITNPPNTCLTFPDGTVSSKRLNQWLYETIEERNHKFYEGKLYKRNLRDLGPISRPKYERLVKFSKLVIDDIFYKTSKNKFQNLQILIK